MQLTLGPALGIAIAMLALVAALVVQLGVLGRSRDVLTAVARAAPRAVR